MLKSVILRGICVVLFSRHSCWLHHKFDYHLGFGHTSICNPINWKSNKIVVKICVSTNNCSHPSMLLLLLHWPMIYLHFHSYPHSMQKNCTIAIICTTRDKWVHNIIIKLDAAKLSRIIRIFVWKIDSIECTNGFWSTKFWILYHVI